MTYTLIDLKATQDQRAFDKLVKLEQEISKDTHRNAGNYRNIDKKVDEFISFEVLIHDDTEELVAISGLYNNGWYPSDHARVSTRTYYVPKFRNSPLTSFRGNGAQNAWAEEYFIPYEVVKCRETGITVPFISIEYLSRRKAITALCDRLNHLHGHRWQINDAMYNTCRQHNDDGKYIGINPAATCWQNCCYYLLDNNATFSLPEMSDDEWFKKFKDNQNDRIHT